MQQLAIGARLELHTAMEDDGVHEEQGAMGDQVAMEQDNPLGPPQEDIIDLPVHDEVAAEANIVLDSQAAMPNGDGQANIVQDSQAAMLDGEGQFSSQACFSFLTCTVATLATVLAQIPAILNGGLIDTTTFEGIREESYRLYMRRRRRNVVCLTYIHIMYHFLVLHNQLRNPRQLGSEWYIKPRCRQWFVLFLITMPNVDPERFCQFFRVSPTLFQYICEMLHDDLITNPPESLHILPNRVLQVKRQVGIAICRLCTGNTFLVVAELFGVSKATAVIATWKFIQAINQRARRLIRWPNAAGMAIVKEKFLERTGFPNCCGAIDGTHFPVEVPAGENSVDYYDYKHNISISMQAIVDPDLRFMDVVAGWPGSVQDTRLLRRSKFFAAVVYRGTRLSGPPFVDVNGHHIREYLLGDSGYPLYDWLINPFATDITPEEAEWNHRHSSARICVERAFGRLKGTWRILLRILWKPKMDRIGPMIYSCCILHNLIIDRQDGLNPAVYEGIRAHPNGYGPYARPQRARFAGGPQARGRIMAEVERRAHGQ